MGQSVLRVGLRSPSRLPAPHFSHSYSPHPTLLRVLASWPSQIRGPGSPGTCCPLPGSHFLLPHPTPGSVHDPPRGDPSFQPGTVLLGRPRPLPPRPEDRQFHGLLCPAGLCKGPSAPSGWRPPWGAATMSRGSLRGSAEGRTPRWPP